jgi:hypothetical protein
MGELTYRIEKVTVDGVDGEYDNLELPEGAIVLHSYPELDMVVLLVAVPANEERDESCTRCGATPETGQTPGCFECEGVTGPLVPAEKCENCNGGGCLNENGQPTVWGRADSYECQECGGTGLVPANEETQSAESECPSCHGAGWATVRAGNVTAASGPCRCTGGSVWAVPAKEEHGS